MKKLISLVLALVMLAGVAAVGEGFADSYDITVWVAEEIKELTAQQIDAFNSNNQYGYVRNRFNIYWGFAGGVEVSDTFRVEVGFDLGFLDLGRGKELHIGRNFLHFGLGYLF